jgi:hypothetical protein
MFDLSSALTPENCERQLTEIILDQFSSTSRHGDRSILQCPASPVGEDVGLVVEMQVRLTAASTVQATSHPRSLTS